MGNLFKTDHESQLAFIFSKSILCSYFLNTTEVSISFLGES